MQRVPDVERADLDETGRRIYDEIAESRGRVQGPFSVLLHSPEFAARAARLGAYVRYEAPMPARHRHLIALIAARELDAQYEFTVHARLGREEGIPADAVTAIGHGEAPEGLRPDEALLVSFTRELVRQHRVNDAIFDAARDEWGLRGLTDIVGAIAYFSMVAFPLIAFNVPVRGEHTPELPVNS
jgi:4-carboxymuconolactone decarboxylase